MNFIITKPEKKEEEQEQEQEQTGFIIKAPAENKKESREELKKRLREEANPFSKMKKDAKRLGSFAGKALEGAKTSVEAVTKDIEKLKEPVDNVFNALGISLPEIPQTPFEQTQKNYDQKYQEYTKQGMSPEEAETRLGKRPYPLTNDMLVDAYQNLVSYDKDWMDEILEEGVKTGAEFYTFGGMIPGVSVPPSIKEMGHGFVFGTAAEAAKQAGSDSLGQIIAGFTALYGKKALKGGWNVLKKGVEFGRKLLDASKIPQEFPLFLTETSEAALADLELSQRNLTKRMAKVNDTAVKTFEDNISKIAEPNYSEVGEYNTREIQNEIERKAIEQTQSLFLDKIVELPKSRKSAWEDIQKVVNNNFSAAKESYKSLYETAEFLGARMEVMPSASFDAARNLTHEMRGTLLNIAEETKVSKVAETIVENLLPENIAEQTENIFQQLTNEGLDVDYQEVAQWVQDAVQNPQAVTVDRLMKTSRSISRILSKADIMPAPVKLLSQIQEAIKLDIQRGLRPNDIALNTWNQAEELYGKTHQTFGKDSVKKFMKSEAPSAMAYKYTDANHLEQLKKALPDSPEAQKYLDRLVTENILSKPRNEAIKAAQEASPYLSAEAQKALEEALAIGDNLTTPAAQSAARAKLFEDVQKVIAGTGEADYALNLMKSPNGYRFVEKSLSHTKQGKQIFKGLQRSMMEGIFKQFTNKKNQLDFDKISQSLRDPHTRFLIKESMGEETLKFMQNLDFYGKNLSTNINNLAEKNFSGLRNIFKQYGSKAKYALVALSPFMKLAVIPAIGLEVGERAYRANLYRVMRNPQSRNILKKMGQKNVSSGEMQKMLSRYLQITKRLEEEQEEQEE